MTYASSQRSPDRGSKAETAGGGLICKDPIDRLLHALLHTFVVVKPGLLGKLAEISKGKARLVVCSAQP